MKPMQIAGLILAGGQARRMNGLDKGLQLLQQQPLILHVINRLSPQMNGHIWISANRYIEQYQMLGYPVFQDRSEYQGCGPLAGIASLIEYLPEQFTHIQIAPCDTPFLPNNMVKQLSQTIQTQAAHAVYPETTEGAQYSCALFERMQLHSAIQSLNHGERSLRAWLTHADAQAVQGFSAEQFMNINHSSELDALNQASHTII